MLATNTETYMPAKKQRRVDDKQPKPPANGKPPPTIRELRVYGELMGNTSGMVKTVVERFGHAARGVLLRYIAEVGGANGKIMAAALDKYAAPKDRGPTPTGLHTINSEGRVTINAKALGKPNDRVRIELRKIDGFDALVIARARRSTDQT